MSTYPAYYYDYLQGCLLHRVDDDTLVYYYFHDGRLDQPMTNERYALQLQVTRQQGYDPEQLTADCMPIEQDKFERLLAPCTIKSVTFADPLPSWFSWPSRSR